MQKLLAPFEKIWKYLLAAILIVIPLYPKFPFIKVFGTYVSIRFEDFLIAFVGLITLVKLLPKVKELLADRIVRSMLVYLLVGVVSLASGIFLTQTVVGSIGILHLLRRVEYFVPFFFALAFFKDDSSGNLEFLIKVLMIVITGAFIFGVGQEHFNFPVIITQNMEYSKGIALRYVPGSQLNSTFAGHYDLAGFLVLTLPIFWSLFFTIKGKLSKVSIAVILLFGLWLLGATASRISAVAYLGGTSLALLILKKYKAILIMGIVSIIFFATSSSLLGRYGQIFKVLLSGSTPVVHAQESTPTPSPSPMPVLEDRSTSIRLNVEWPRAIRALEKNPLLGTGYSSINLATDNDFLRALGEVGLLGFAAFILLLTAVGATWKKFLPKLNTKSDITKAYMAGAMGAFAGVLVNITFIDLFEASKFAIIFWLLIGISIKIANE